MFQRVRKHINPATILALAALVFAATGGAFAATGGGGNGGGGNSPVKVTASVTHNIAMVAAKKKAAVKGVRGPAGPRGAAGPVGPVGPMGATGVAGAKGENGAAGGQGSQGSQGSEGKQGVPGAPGANGTTGFTETLPSGKTEKGTWAYSGLAGDGEADVAISFPIPLKEAIASVHFVNEKGGEIIEREEHKSTVCTGAGVAPTAPAGTLCVYENFQSTPIAEGANEEEVQFLSVEGTRVSGAAGTSGSIMRISGEPAGARGWGTWAVTAP